MNKKPLTVSEVGRIGGIASQKRLSKAQRHAHAVYMNAVRWKGHKKKKK